MSAFDKLLAAFEQPRDRFLASVPIQRLMRGELGARHYAQLMRQVFHQARENPQIQAYATVRFRGPQREAVGLFYRHAISEIGHDELALSDFVACGGDATNVRTENPHPATAAVTAFAFHQISNGNPVGYLGYLFFLEFLPTTRGELLVNQLKASGVPENAFTFLRDHIQVDVGHNKAMEKYCELLLNDERAFAAAKYAMTATGYLYTQMVSAAIEVADTHEDFGIAYEEMVV